MIRAVAAGLAAALAVTGTGCRADKREPKVVIETVFLERLSAAIRGVNAARQRLADDGNALGTAAQALDDVDAVAVTGDRQAVRDKRKPAANAMTTAGPVARRIGKDVTAYEQAITALEAADTPGLTAEQVAAIADAVSAGKAEVAELKRYGAAVATSWPRYEKLDSDQKLWLTRASNGWYRDQQEAAGAYVVMTDRRTLTPARRSFAAADSRRVAAAREAARSFEKAGAALAPLLS